MSRREHKNGTLALVSQQHNPLFYDALPILVPPIVFTGHPPLYAALFEGKGGLGEDSSHPLPIHIQAVS